MIDYICPKTEKRTEKELRNELKYLLNLWERIKTRGTRQAAPVRVYEEYGVVLRLIRDIFTEDVTRLVVDSKDEYARIVKFLKAFGCNCKNGSKFEDTKSAAVKTQT